MRKKDIESILEPFLRVESCDWADIVHLKVDIMSLVEVSLCLEAFRHLLLELELSPGKPLVLKAARDSFSPDRIDTLIKHIGDLQQEYSSSIFSYLSLSEVTIKREENMYGHFIEWIRFVERPVMMVYQGQTALPLLGIGLACDYRIATTDTIFHNGTWKHEIPQGFGLLYLLPAYIGFGRAQTLVTMTDTLDAEQAMAWGLLDQTATTDALETVVTTKAKQFSAFHSETTGCIKALLNMHLPDCTAFFSMECEGIEKAFRREPWKKLSE